MRIKQDGDIKVINEWKSVKYEHSRRTATEINERETDEKNANDECEPLTVANK